ncbi:MAG: GAK system CofD-like protein [Thermodesulfobacteriota bacterium]
MPDKIVNKIVLTRTVILPDPVRTAMCRRSPDLGPRILFFSGGSALRRLSQKLVDYTHNSIHLITPFDSGGSSAVLRKAFRMPAVGDIRNRIMALADRSVKGNPEIFELFAHRLSKTDPIDALRARLEAMVMGTDPMIRAVPDPMRKIIRSHLGFFKDRSPKDFDLRGASVGNLILTGGYFNYKRQIDPVIYLFSRLVEARGVVRPIINADLHLVTELKDGTRLVGQHLLTGKEVPPIASPVREVHLADDPAGFIPVEPRLKEKVARRIKNADLICYPMGSFYSSLVANLLVKGVGDAVAVADCPRVYIPNQGHDPEEYGMSLADRVETLFRYLEKSCTAPVERSRLLQFVLVDSSPDAAFGASEISRVRRMGVKVIEAELVSEKSRPYLDPRRVIEHLVALS